MSNSSRKDFDVKHILRLRWKLFSHPAAPSGGCLQQDSSFEHWGPSQSRLLKNQERSSGAFWKKSSSSSSSSSNNSASSSSSSSTLLNGTLLPTTRLHALAEPPPRTVFYVESLEGGLGEITRTPQQDTQGVKEEPPPFLDGGGGQATGEGAAHRLSAVSHPMTPQCDMDSSTSEEYYQAVHHAEQTFRKMESYLKQQQLCDVILIAGNRKIPAHR